MNNQIQELLAMLPEEERTEMEDAIRSVFFTASVSGKDAAFDEALDLDVPVEVFDRLAYFLDLDEQDRVNALARKAKEFANLAEFKKKCAEEETLLRKLYEAKAAKLKQQLCRVLPKSLTTDKYKLIRRNADKFEYDNEVIPSSFKFYQITDKLNDEDAIKLRREGYTVDPIAINKTEIKKAIKAGDIIPGVVVIKGGTKSVTIK